MAGRKKRAATNSAEENCNVEEEENKRRIIPHRKCDLPVQAKRPRSTDKTVTNWLLTLLDPRMDREPEEFYVEQEMLRVYRERAPEYSLAAQCWPLDAAQYWSTVGHLVKRLFSTRFAFIQWALEFARNCYPHIYGATAPTNDAILDLTQALHDGSLSTLHMSAVIRLEPLCLDLMELPFMPPRSFGKTSAPFRASPLLYALAGPQIFAYGTSISKWAKHSEHLCQIPNSNNGKKPNSNDGNTLYTSDELHQIALRKRRKEMHIHYNYFGQTVVIRRLIDLGKQGRIPFDKSGQKGRLLIALAYQASIKAGDATILPQILEGGGDAEALADLLDGNVFLCDNSDRETTLATTGLILTRILDLLLAPSRLNLKDHARTPLISAIYCARRRVPAMDAIPGEEEVAISDSEFHEAMECALLEGNLTCLERLTEHRSFDANAADVISQDGSTLLHHIVCDGLVNAVDVLVRAGSDLEARDDAGRTPLLVCDGVMMLSRLVRYGADTSAVDNEGRNIWHYVAATADVRLLEWLEYNDDKRPANMAARTAEGDTPLDLALAQGVDCLSALREGGLEGEEQKLKNTFIVVNMLLSQEAPYSDIVRGATMGGDTVEASWIIDKLNI